MSDTEISEVKDPNAYSYDYTVAEETEGRTILSSANPPREDYARIKLTKKPKSVAVVDEDSCVGCEYCVHVCPIPNCLALAAVEVNPAQINTICIVNDETCIACRACEIACPYDAIHVVKREEVGEWKYSVNLPKFAE